MVLRHPGAFKVFKGEVFFLNRSKVVFFLCYLGILIDLVEQHDRGFIGSTDIRQGLIHHLNLFFKGRMRDIRNVNQNISFTYFIQGGFKRFNQRMGQFPDESNSI